MYILIIEANFAFQILPLETRFWMRLGSNNPLVPRVQKLKIHLTEIWLSIVNLLCK